ncbi:leucine-rich repeat-containing protein 17-like [Megalops cyprinoides]|uniref:leucine-rich repeat-containing protein 17-like n=1 Tax=Megalops cyprinoides TaxID=118141 RepID=UPI001864ED74|nr:leucine-rich repeat-containing protein 17-like [Megalops cyprinoides]
MWYVWALPLLMVLHCRSTLHSSGWCRKGCDCHGEFKLMNCSDTLLTHIPTNIPPFTEHLDLSLNQLGLVPARAFQALLRLRVLLLNDNNISSVAVGAFSPLESLQRLDLSRNSISYLTKGFFLGLGSLKELQLSENRLTHLDSGNFQHLDSLQRLNLSSNKISSIQVRAFCCMTVLRNLYLEDNQLRCLSNGVFSTLRSLEVLYLQQNNISSTEPGVFTPLTSLALLNLANNCLSFIPFKTFLSIHTPGTHILLADNPWHCHCDLQRVFRKVRSVQRLFLDDYYNLSCREPPELQGYQLMEVDAELCIAETVTVLIITVTVVITVVAAIVMAEKSRKKRTGKQWCEDNHVTYNYQS